MKNNIKTPATPEEHLAVLVTETAALNESQRAMAAARFLNRHKHVLSQVVLAKALSINRGSVSNAIQVIKRGTRKEVDGIEAGALSVSTVHLMLRKGISADDRASSRAAPRSSKGKFPDAIQARRDQQQIWERLRDAIQNLTSLPLPSDVGAIVNVSPTRKRIVDQTLSKALQYLKEFSDEWDKRSKNSATIYAESGVADAGTGERAA